MSKRVHYPQHIIPHEDLGINVQNIKLVMAEMQHEFQPCRGINGEVRGGIDSINRPLPQSVTFAIRGSVFPSWIRVPVGDSLSHLQLRGREHVMEGAVCHIFISIDESDQALTILPPCMKQSAYIYQENGAWAVPYPLGLKVAAVLIHYGEGTTGAARLAGDIDGDDTCHMPMMALKLSPGKAAEVAIIHPSVYHACGQFPKGELEGATILPSAEVLMGVVSCDRTKGVLTLK